MPKKSNVKLPPSPAHQRIVDENGLPTIYFTRFLVDIMSGVGVVDANGDGISEALAKLALVVEQNKTDIQAVDTKVDTKTDANATLIADNTTAIGTNTQGITDNATAIGDNATAIGTNTTHIGNLSSLNTSNKSNLVSAINEKT